MEKNIKDEILKMWLWQYPFHPFETKEGYLEFTKDPIKYLKRIRENRGINKMKTISLILGCVGLFIFSYGIHYPIYKRPVIIGSILILLGIALDWIYL